MFSHFTEDMSRSLPRSPVLIVGNLSPFESENRSNLLKAMNVYDAQVIDANGASLQSLSARAVNRARIHMNLWQKIADLEFGPTQWVIIIEETARVLHPSLLDSLFEAQHAPILESAGIIMLGTTQTSRVLPNVTGGVEVLSEKSSALLQANSLAYALTPEFAARLYASNVNDPVAISHVLTDMYGVTKMEPPRFFRMSFPAFDVSGPKKPEPVRLPDSKNILTGDSSSDSMKLENISMSESILPKPKPQPPVSMASISEAFYTTTDNKRKQETKNNQNSDHMSKSARTPIRMQATREARAAARNEFESDLAKVDFEADNQISRYASLTLVFLVLLIIVGYMLIRFSRNAHFDVWGGEARMRKVSYIPSTESGGATTTESTTSLEIEPIF